MKELSMTQMERINGGDTMSCIQDAYSNHGLVSAWLFVQTAFIPWTAAAIAFTCFVSNNG